MQNWAFFSRMGIVFFHEEKNVFCTWRACLLSKLRDVWLACSHVSLPGVTATGDQRWLPVGYLICLSQSRASLWQMGHWNAAPVLIPLFSLTCHVLIFFFLSVYKHLTLEEGDKAVVLPVSHFLTKLFHSPNNSYFLTKLGLWYWMVFTFYILDSCISVSLTLNLPPLNE